MLQSWADNGRAMEAGTLTTRPSPQEIQSVCVHTVADVAGAVAPHEHARRVRAWAESAWSAWS